MAEQDKKELTEQELKEARDQLVHFGLLGFFLLAVILVSIVFFHHVEHWNWLNSYYFTIITIATVGYGDFVPTTPAGKIGATILVFIGIGTFATFANLLLRRRALKRSERKLRK